MTTQPPLLVDWLRTLGIRDVAADNRPSSGGLDRAVTRRLHQLRRAVAERPTARRQRAIYSFVATPDRYGVLHSIKADAIRASGAAVATHLEGFVRGARILDLGCNGGHLTLWFAQCFPHLSFVGCDFVPEAITLATQLADTHGITNAQFELVDLTTDIPQGPFDAVISTQSLSAIDGDLVSILERVASVVCEGGSLFAVEVLPTEHHARAFAATATDFGLAPVGIGSVPFDDGNGPQAYPTLTFRKGATPIDLPIGETFTAIVRDMQHRYRLQNGWDIGDEEAEVATQANAVQ